MQGWRIVGQRGPRVEVRRRGKGTRTQIRRPSRRKWRVPGIVAQLVNPHVAVGGFKAWLLLTELSRVFYDTPCDSEIVLPEGQASAPATAMWLGTDSTFPVA
jgi:hypothetical protein